MSDMPNFIRLMKTNEVHYYGKLHKNLTSSFRVTDNFLAQRYKDNSQVQKALLGFRITHILTQVSSVSDPFSSVFA